ncbi:hypothetical protein GCM10025862_02840 [Arsenicicoccus piscis]|uniref:Cholesterol oxidase substrate-binding domain-containing protein n=1 Tax=Arsenicicoccus piscis TaxID=673954 RepID=A0ABQ6HKT6_9MICO|nr:hypothetical protein GCM10025862_02840 [Arsenicicoccus piscis]
MLAAGAAGSVAALTGWSVVGRATPAEAAALAPTLLPPPGLPAGLVPYLTVYRNWSGAITTDALWAVTPLGTDAIVALANWAHANGWTIRPRGFSHNWSPLTVTGGEDGSSRVLLVDTTTGLLGTQVDRAARTVSVGAGDRRAAARRGDLRLAIQPRRRPRRRRVGRGARGVRAADLPAHRPPDRCAARAPRARLRHPGAAVHHRPAEAALPQRHDDPRERAAGRAGVGRSHGRTVASFLDQSGRMEIILFPFTKTPWLKVWTVPPWPPLGSRPTVLPYNYAFADLLPKPITDLVEGIQRGNVSLAPTFGATQLSIVQGGLLSSLTSDLWGSAKDLLLYVRPTTLRVTANGYAVLYRRADVQGVLHEIYTTYTTLVDRYAAGGRYPMNGPLELRVTGLDQPGDVAIPGAVEPLLSAVRRRPDRPDLDTAIWIDVLTLPGTPAAEEFYTELEQWLFGRAGAGDIDVRVEWSKGWAYTPTAGWADRETITGTIPRSLTTGQPAGADFASARATLAALDPHRIYRSPLLDLLLP